MEQNNSISQLMALYTKQDITLIHTNNKIANENYCLIYYSKNYENVKNFALKFGKTIPAAEQNYLRGYSLHFNKTQRTIQGVTHYTTEKNESKEECNNMIKNIFCDMIENRYEDTTTY